LNKNKELDAAAGQLEKAVELIQVEANYSKRLEPLFYILKLVLGIVFAIMSILWILHMLIHKQITLYDHQSKRKACSKLF
jgi:hypothetical protein